MHGSILKDSSKQGLLQTLPPFLLKIISTYPHYKFYMMWSGMFLVVASSIGAAFSTSASVQASDP